MTSIFQAARRLGAGVAVLLLAGTLAAQQSQEQVKRALREAAFEVIFAKDEAAVQKHLLKATNDFLAKLDAEQRTKFLKDLMFAEDASKHGATLERVEGDKPFVRSTKASEADVFELSLASLEVHGDEAAVEVTVQRTVHGQPPPQSWSWPRRFRVQARREEGAWRLASLQFLDPQSPLMALDNTEFLDRVTGGARRDANEVAALGNLRVLNTAQVTYYSEYPDSGFACTLQQLSGSGGEPTREHSNLIDDVLGSGKKSGYIFTLTCKGKPAMEYTITAVPVEPGKSGRRAFCTDTSAVLYYADDGKAETCLADKNPVQ